MKTSETRQQQATGIAHAFWLGLRKVAIGTLRRFNPGDISIRHHYTGDTVKLHSFMHKGYWYYGKRRESASMELFARLVRERDTVIEVGGHIGYISLYFSKLVGPDGGVIVFEPGTNNLPYTRANLRSKSNVQLIESAVADFCGKASFYVEDYTGQNNSLISDYSRFDDNLKNAGIQLQVKKSVVEVDCLTLDEFVTKLAVRPPSFIKIDVEGAELAVLKGMQRTLRSENLALMVEVTEHAAAVYDLLTAAGFKPYSDRRTRIRNPEGLRENTFWLKDTDPRRQEFHLD
ncbi:MAG: FkbM family methyltransferase [Steroidobacteraceae bacterium]